MQKIVPQTCSEEIAEEAKMHTARKFSLLTFTLLIALGVFAVNALPATAQGPIIPPGATIDSATFSIYVTEFGPPGPPVIVNMHRITATWTEPGVTWANFGGSYDPAVVGSFTASASGWQTADVTALVRAWVNNTYRNYGVLLEQTAQQFPATYYASSEYPYDASLRPRL
jgi:hypothetical protein